MRDRVDTTLLPCLGFLPRLLLSVPGRTDHGEADSDRRKERREHVTDYEILLLLDPDADEAKQADVVSRTRETIEKGGGAVDRHDVWGRRKLAYEIDHKSDGSYHLLTFACSAQALAEVERVLKIDDVVMRHMATRRKQGSPIPTLAPEPPASDDGAESAPTPAPEEEE
jgi:small subunit ribosomal protein S6